MRTFIGFLLGAAILAAVSFPAGACDGACRNPNSKFNGASYLSGKDAESFRYKPRTKYVVRSRWVKKYTASPEKKAAVEPGIVAAPSVAAEPIAHDGGLVKRDVTRLYLYAQGHARVMLTALTNPGYRPQSPSARAAIGDRLDGKFNWQLPLDVRLLAEAKNWLGATASDLGVPRTLWCADALNKWLANIDTRGTGSRAARSFVDWSRPSSGRVGDIVVLRRGGDPTKGHAGVVARFDEDRNPILISGNHGGRVREALYPKERVIAYRALPIQS